MAEIRVVQLAMTTDADGNIHTLYLDDQGRVWQDAGDFVVDEKKSERDKKGNLTKSVRKWTHKWRRVKLPQAPAV